MLSTSQLRNVWAPACRAKGAVLLAAYAALDVCLRRHSYRPRRADTGAYNCRRITGGSGYSLHAYGPGDPFTFWNGIRIATALAVDLNWQTNPYGPRLITDMPTAMVNDILAIRTNSGAQVWGWGGHYRTNKDAMHYEIVCSPAALASGIDPASLPGAKPGRPAKWAPFRPGDTDRAIAARGGQRHQVAELQMILGHLADEWDAPELDPGPVDGAYGPRSQAAVSAFKARIIGLQRSLGSPPWPNTDALVGPKTIAMARWWNQAG